MNIGFGLHAGWAVEGPIGSSIKVDCSYLGPHQDMVGLGPCRAHTLPPCFRNPLRFPRSPPFLSVSLSRARSLSAARLKMTPSAFRCRRSGLRQQRRYTVSGCLSRRAFTSCCLLSESAICGRLTECCAKSWGRMEKQCLCGSTRSPAVPTRAIEHSRRKMPTRRTSKMAWRTT